MRSRRMIQIEAKYRKFLLRFFQKQFPIYLVTEYPKSGASWLGQMLSECIPAPFPRQKFPKFGKSIFHGHYLQKKYNGPTVVFWRDPRDIMVSWYYHCLFQSDKNHPSFVAQHVCALQFKDVENISKNLPRFIDFMFTTPLSPRFTFNMFFDSWFDFSSAVHVKYESMISDTGATLVSTLNNLGIECKRETIDKSVEKYSFNNQANRAPGDEKTTSYLRKGIVGDWKNHFTDESKQIFLNHIGNRLVQLEYEQDNTWAK